METSITAAITGYIETLAEDGIGIHERLSVWAVLVDVLAAANVPPDDWPATVLEATDTVAPVPAA